MSQAMLRIMIDAVTEHVDLFPRTALNPPIGRRGKRRQLTRARLLAAAYHVMSKTGVDNAKIKDVTEYADVGFGTFYNYFETKDQLAAEVLDCVIDDLGRRNRLATEKVRRKSRAFVMPVSIRLWLREAMHVPMWDWWAMRPDLLVDRMRKGFGRFALKDIRDGIASGTFHLAEEHIEALWSIACWMMVGAIHDIDVGTRPRNDEFLVVESIMRMMGVEPAIAKRMSCGPLPIMPGQSIDWTFMLDQGDTVSI